MSKKVTIQEISSLNFEKDSNLNILKLKIRLSISHVYSIINSSFGKVSINDSFLAKSLSETPQLIWGYRLTT